VTGCNTETLVLTITPSTNITTTISACDTYNWAVNNTTYAQSGTYTSVTGCNTETLVLTITPSTNNTTTISACGDYTWTANGVNYQQSGTYIHTVGCHTDTLVLNITPSTGTTITEVACGSYTWIVNNQTYAQSGTYISASDCHTDTLVLTIGSPADAAFYYAQPVYCSSAMPPSPWVAEQGGSFTSTPDGLMIDPITGILLPDASAPGTYTVRHGFLGNCPSMDSTTVELRAIPTISIIPVGPQCEGGAPIELSALATPTGGTWIGDAVLNASFTPTSPGAHALGYSWSDGTCSAQSVLVVEVLPMPNANAGPDLSTCGNEVGMQAMITNGIGLWTLPAELTGSDLQASDALIGSNSIGIFSLVWTVNSGGCLAQDTAQVTFLDPGTGLWVNAGTDQILEMSTNTVLNGSATVGADLLWTVLTGPGTLFDADEPTAYLNDLAPGDHLLILNASLNTCSSVSDTVLITVLDLFIPEGYSPNGDGVNDTFRITGLGNHPGSKVKVFNRWGQQVFTSDDYANEWSGRSDNGKELPDGTYFYVLNLGNERTYNGHVIIKR